MVKKNQLERLLKNILEAKDEGIKWSADIDYVKGTKNFTCCAFGMAAYSQVRRESCDPSDTKWYIKAKAQKLRVELADHYTVPDKYHLIGIGINNEKPRFSYDGELFCTALIRFNDRYAENLQDIVDFIQACIEIAPN